MAFLNAFATLRQSRRLTVIVMLLVLVTSRPGAPSTLEYEVKAAFLYNFLNFVTWPASAFAAPSDAVRVCVFGSDPFGPVLDRTMQGGTAGTHPVVVDRVRDQNAVTRCSVVFVPREAATRTEEVIGATASRPVLTVGESPEFLAKGGMINFVLEGGKVRFDVNLPAASAHGLSLSSRLLRVARTTIRAATGA